MSLFEELKRRRVFRLIAAYLVVAWLLVQVVTAIEEPLRLPDWFDTAVIVLLGLGFPIAVIISWVYDVTPDGVVRDDGSRAMPSGIDYGKIALVAVLILSAFLVGNFIADTSPQSPVITERTQSFEPRQFEIGLGQLLSGANDWASTVALTPDDQSIVFHATSDGKDQLFVRPLGNLDVSGIDGTEGATNSFAISPDGEWIAFYSGTDQFLKKISISGGIPIPLGKPDSQVRHIAWGDSGTIVFQEVRYTGLRQISSAGGPIESISTADEGLTQKQPSFIPNSDSLLIAVGERGQSANSLDQIAILQPGGKPELISIQGSSPRILPQGLLVYFNRNALWATKFDLDKYEILGEPKPIVNDVSYSRMALYDVSADGALVYRRNSARGNNELVWVDRQGNEEAIAIRTSRYCCPEVSPDGDTLAVTMDTPYLPDIWTYSLKDYSAVRQTEEETRETSLLWSPNGQYLYFEQQLNGGVYRLSVNDHGPVEKLSKVNAHWYPYSISSDGRNIFVSEFRSGVGDGTNIAVLDIENNRPFTRLLESDIWESHPAISPDGGTLAYMLRRNEESEIFVRPYPMNGGEARRVSGRGAWLPEWNVDESELFYWDVDDDAMFAVELDTSDSITASPPRRLFGTESYVFDVVGNFDYDPTRDKFLMVKKPPPGTEPDEFIYMQNWLALISDDAK
jgi:Tol biopolymer transport system component